MGLTAKEWDHVNTQLELMHSINLHSYGEMISKQNVKVLLAQFIDDPLIQIDWFDDPEHGRGYTIKRFRPVMLPPEESEDGSDLHSDEKSSPSA